MPMRLCQNCEQVLAEDISSCKAIDHYREALGAYMDDMIEYVFAVERIRKLRQTSH